MSKSLPDEIRYSRDPEIVAKLATLDGHRELVNEYGVDDDDPGTPGSDTLPPSGQADPEPPQGASGSDPDTSASKPNDPPADPASQQAGNQQAGQQDTPPDGDVQLTEAETRKLMRLGIIDDKGRFLGRYPDAHKMVEAIKHKDQIISSKIGEWIKRNPDAAKELLVDTGVVESVTPPPAADPASAGAAAGKDQAGTQGSPSDPAGQPAGQPAQPAQAPNSPVHMPGQPGPEAPTPDAIIETVLSQQMPKINDVLAQEFAADLAELGVAIPEPGDRKGWRDLFDMAPGLAADLRDRYNEIAHEQQQTRALLEHTSKLLIERRQQRPQYEDGLLKSEREQLIADGYPPELIDKAQTELLARRRDDMNADLTYFDDTDAMGNRIFVPVLKQGALRSYLIGNHLDALTDARVEAKVNEKLAKEREWREGKQRRAGLFPDTIIGKAGQSQPRASLDGMHPTPEQYHDDMWRMEHLRTPQDREAVRQWIDSLEPDRRRQYRSRQ